MSLIELLPGGPDRAARELHVQNRLVTSLIVMHGWAAPVVGVASSRARELCRQIGESDGLFTTLNNLVSFHYVSGDLATAEEIARQLLTVGEERANTMWLCSGHLFLGIVQLHTGRLAAAEASFETLLELALELDLSHEVTEQFFGMHPLPVGLAYSSWRAYLAGDDARAHALSSEAVALSTALGHPQTQAFAWYQEAHLQILTDDPRAVLASCERAIPYCQERGLAVFAAWMSAFRGWATAVDGHPDDGVSEIRAALAVHRASGGQIPTPLLLGLLADGEARRGNAEQAIAILDTALSLPGGDALWESELHRHRGELLAEAGPEHRDASLHALREAISVATRQGAHGSRARAVAALARLGPAAGTAIAAASSASPPSGLSPRELQLLTLLGTGLTDKQIAVELVVSLATVRSHLDRIRDKTGRRRRPELSRLADELGLTATI